MKTISLYHVPYGEAASILIDWGGGASALQEANVQSRPAVRVTLSGKQFEGEQVIDSLNYFTEGDWNFFYDKTQLSPMKLVRQAHRLRCWGGGSSTWRNAAENPDWYPSVLPLQKGQHGELYRAISCQLASRTRSCTNGR